MEIYIAENYNFEFADEEVEATITSSKQGAKPKTKDFDFCIPYKEFELGGHLEIKEHKYPLPEVPASFSPEIKQADLPYKQPIPQRAGKMNAESRAILLGEKTALSKEAKEKIIGKAKVFVQDNQEVFSATDIVINLPFANDSSKMERFKAYFSEKRGQKVPGITMSNVYTLFK